MRPPPIIPATPIHPDAHLVRRLLRAKLGQSRRVENPEPGALVYVVADTLPAKSIRRTVVLPDGWPHVHTDGAMWVADHKPDHGDPGMRHAVMLALKAKGGAATTVDVAARIVAANTSQRSCSARVQAVRSALRSLSEHGVVRYDRRSMAWMLLATWAER